MVQPVRFEDTPERKLVGLRRSHEMAEAPITIPPQWMAFREMKMPETAIEGTVYGINCQTDMHAGTFEYMTAIEVTKFPESASFDRLQMSPSLYAVFEHTGVVTGIGNTWQTIFNDWLPSSGYALN